MGQGLHTKMVQVSGGQFSYSVKTSAVRAHTQIQYNYSDLCHGYCSAVLHSISLAHLPLSVPLYQLSCTH